MSEEINESVLVTARFDRGRLIPLLFGWRGRSYRVDRVDFAWASRKGEAKLYFFAVSGAGARYQLMFNDKTLDWRLGKLEAIS